MASPSDGYVDILIFFLLETYPGFDNDALTNSIFIGHTPQLDVFNQKDRPRVRIYTFFSSLISMDRRGYEEKPFLIMTIYLPDNGDYSLISLSLIGNLSIQI
jgi:hypothetical protein